jgi:tryptophan-rich sensory protein
MTPDQTPEWYAMLAKPWFAPPAEVFGPVWSVLYVLIAVSFGYVFWQAIRGRWPWPVALLFLINLAANLAYTPLQFGLRSNELALVDILVVLITIPLMMRAAWPRARWVAWLQVPYLLWVAFATVLQVSITWLNAGR